MNTAWLRFLPSLGGENEKRPALQKGWGNGKVSNWNHLQRLLWCCINMTNIYFLSDCLFSNPLQTLFFLLSVFAFCCLAYYLLTHACCSKTFWGNARNENALLGSLPGCRALCPNGRWKDFSPFTMSSVYARKIFLVISSFLDRNKNNTTSLPQILCMWTA